MPIRVLVVDDSATVRALLSEILNSDPGIEVVGTAPDAYVARDKIVQLKPDVICLDVEMPKMDGITFLRKLMKYFPTPVLMVSSLTKQGAQITLDALESGAMDFVTKPHTNIYDGIDEIEKEIVSKVKAIARSKPKAPSLQRSHPAVLSRALSETTKKVIAIGASTGGTEALKDVLERLPSNTPGIVIVQHMPPSFTTNYAKRLDSLCEMEVKEAENGDYVEVGRVLIANGAYHMALRRSGARYCVELGEGEKVSGHKPSVDVLFGSVAKYAGANAIGVILTGMGADGARGLLQMREAGARTIAQDEKSCVVFGMPKVAIELGGAERECALLDIPAAILDLVNQLQG